MVMTTLFAFLIHRANRRHVLSSKIGRFIYAQMLELQKSLVGR